MKGASKTPEVDVDGWDQTVLDALVERERLRAQLAADERARRRDKDARRKLAEEQAMRDALKAAGAVQQGVWVGHVSPPAASPMQQAQLAQQASRGEAVPVLVLPTPPLTSVGPLMKPPGTAPGRRPSVSELLMRAGSPPTYDAHANSLSLSRKVHVPPKGAHRSPSPVRGIASLMVTAPHAVGMAGPNRKPKPKPKPQRRRSRKRTKSPKARRNRRERSVQSRQPAGLDALLNGTASIAAASLTSKEHSAAIARMEEIISESKPRKQKRVVTKATREVGW